MQLASHVRPCLGLGPSPVAKNCGAVTGSGGELDSLTVDRKPHGFAGAVTPIIGVLKSISVNPGGPMPMGLPNIGAT